MALGTRINKEEANKRKIEAAIQKAVGKKKPKTKHSLMTNRPAKKQKPKKRKTTVYQDGNSFSQYGKGKSKKY